MQRASRRRDRRESPSTASRSSSRTISMSPVCRRRRPVRPSPIAPSVRRSSSSGSSAPAQSSSARPTSISSRPGLSGVRSPYGVPRNALRPDLIPGGSSSGSATAVGAGLVPFSLGTDTAGSGRVPAALNGIVGLKPSLGALSASGVVPACRTLDTVSIFARDVADAFVVVSRGDRVRRTRRLQPRVPRAGAFGVSERDSARRSPPGSASVLRRQGRVGRLLAGCSRSLNRSAPVSSSSTSSPSPRSPARSMTVRGSPSAMRR